MKHYFENLMIALFGRNPYRQQLYKLKEEMEKAGENVKMLQDSFYREQEKAAQCEKLLDEYKELLEKSDIYREVFESQRKGGE